MTRPPMSSPPIKIASPEDCCAVSPFKESNRIAPVAISGYKTLLVMMFISCVAEGGRQSSPGGNRRSFSLRNESRSNRKHAESSCQLALLVCGKRCALATYGGRFNGRQNMDREPFPWTSKTLVTKVLVRLW